MSNSGLRRFLWPAVLFVGILLLFAWYINQSTEQPDLLRPEGAPETRVSTLAGPFADSEVLVATESEAVPSPWGDLCGSVVHGGSMGVPDLPVEVRTPEGRVVRRGKTDETGDFTLSLEKEVSLPARLSFVVNPGAAARGWKEGTFEVSPQSGLLLFPVKPAEESRRKLTLSFRDNPAISDHREHTRVDLMFPNGRTVPYFVKVGKPTLVIERLQPGIYSLSARLPGWTWSESRVDLVSNHELLIDVVLVQGRNITGRVIDEDGAAVEDCGILLFYDPFWSDRSFSPGALHAMGVEDEAKFFGRRRVVTGSDGTFEFESCPPRDLWICAQKGNFYLPVTSIEDQPEGTGLLELGDLDLGIADGELSVSVMAGKKESLEGATLILSGGLFGPRREPLSGDRGVLCGLVPGEYLVSVSRESTRGRAKVSQRVTDWQRVTVESGGKTEVGLRVLSE